MVLGWSMLQHSSIASVRVLTIMMMAVEKDGRLQVDLSSHSSFDDDIFHVYGCCGYIYYFVRSKNVVFGLAAVKRKQWVI